MQTEALLQGSLPAMAVMAMAAALLVFLGYKKLALVLAGMLTAALVVLSFIPQVWPAQFQRSAMLFAALIAGFYLVVYGLTIGRGERPVLRDVSLGSFGALIVIALAVLVIISDGEALDGLDYADFGGGGSRSAKQKRRM